MRNSRWVIGMATSFVLAGLLAGLADAASPLDGTSWQLKIVTPAEKAPLTDVIRFDQGSFLSSLFRQKGFPPTSRVTLTEEKGRPLVWETLQTNSDRGSISWHGEVEGNTVRGVALQRQPSGPSINYTFTGQKVTTAAGAAPAVPHAPAVSPPKAQAPVTSSPATSTPPAKAKPKTKKVPASPAPSSP